MNTTSLIRAFVKSRTGKRAVRMPGGFHSIVTSRYSAAWGQPPGGVVHEGFRIAVLQPSPQCKGDKPLALYDYIRA